jgi:3D (Asp-Asp-Asp) domain-containing protein
MRFEKLTYALSSLPRRVAMWFHRVRVQTVMAAWYFPERAARVFASARSMPRGRLLVSLLLAGAIVAPTTLYLHERDRRIEVTHAYQQLAFASGAEISTLRQSMGNLLTEQAELKDLLLESGYAVYSDNELSVPVVATGYSSSVWETDSTPFTTAANTRTRHGIVAMSRDLLRRYNPDAPFAFGDVVTISGVGDFIVEDSMNDRWRRRVDVWFPSRSAAVSFGRREVIIRARVEGTDTDVTNDTAYHYTLPVNLASSAGASR